LEKRESRQSRGAADGCESGFLSHHDFSTPLLSLFLSSLSSLFFHQFALFALLSNARVARRFYFLLLSSSRFNPTNGRCCRLIVEPTEAFLTARPASLLSSSLVDNSCYGRLRLGRQLIIELAQVSYSPS